MNTADSSAIRRAMVDQQIETSGVTDARLLSVMRRIPRELFLPEHRRPLAYSDAHHPLGNGRFLPAPAVFAKLVQLADVSATDSVLDFWPGTGYSTAVLAGLAREVIAVEPDLALAEAAQSQLGALSISNARVIAPEYREQDINLFDVIVVEGAVLESPADLIDRLAPGGRMVSLVRQGPVGIATLLIRTPEGVVEQTAFNATLPIIDIAPSSEKFEF